MKAARYEAPGGPDVLSYTEVEAPACPEDGVLLRVEAISIEGGDLINRATTAPQAAGDILGYAASGEIVEVGAQVDDRFVGQKVTSFDMGGSHAELRAVKATRTWVVPDGLDMAAAAALPISFGTAHHSLFARGKLIEGEALLVQGGAGSVGVAAIQLAHRAGAKVLATVSGADRAARLQAYGLDAAIDHRTEDVTEAVMRLTDDRGVDLVVDPVGSTLAGSLAALRPEGRLVFVGNAGRASLELDLWPALQANQTLLGVFMGSHLEKTEVHRTVDDMLHLAAAGEIDVPIERRFPLSQAAAAHAHAEDNSILGRVVLVP